MNPATQTPPALAAGVPSDSLLSLALLGKTALALGLVVTCVLACGWLVRRLGSRPLAAGQVLRVVSSTTVGQREKVVIVQVQDQWLVVGVTAQQVSPLAQLQAPAGPAEPDGQANADRFALRLAQALRHNLQSAGRGPEQAP